MLRLISLLSVVLAFPACAPLRYDWEWNLARQYVSPAVRKMPQADINEITRLVSERSPSPIHCMFYTGRKEPFSGEVCVITADPRTMALNENGLFRLKKEGGVWHIIDAGFTLSTMMIGCGDSDDLMPKKVSRKG